MFERATDYIYIGESPYDENGLQIGDPGLHDEAMRFKDLIERQYPLPKDGLAWLKVKPQHHDFGTYYSVLCYYYTDTAGEEYAFMVESDNEGKLRKWDKQDAIRQERVAQYQHTLLNDMIEE